MEKIITSLAIQFLLLIWNGIHESKTMWSWNRLNSCMHNGLHLAIESALTFGIDDFSYIAKEFRWAWWASDGEQYYSRAVAENNMSATHALEKYFNRKPFIANEVDPPFVARQRQRCRLAVGARFKWNNEWVSVTSIDDKQGIVRACSYKPYERDERNYIIRARRIEHIYRITHKDLKEKMPATIKEEGDNDGKGVGKEI